MRKWRAQIEAPVPTAEELPIILRGSVVLQRFRRLYDGWGRQVRVLGLYWSPALRVTFKIDHESGKVVTVLSERQTEARRDLNSGGADCLRNT
jgi:hypothetical protein